MTRSSIEYWLFHESSDQPEREVKLFTDEERALICSRMAQVAFYFQEGEVTTPTVNDDEKNLLHQMILLRARCQPEQGHIPQPGLATEYTVHQSEKLGAYDALKLLFDYGSPESYVAANAKTAGLRRAFEASCGQPLRDRLSESIVGVEIKG